MNFRKSARKDKPEETDETDEMDEMNEMDENERARRKELKELYVGHRDEFRNNAKAMEELVAWQDRKTDYDYTVMYVRFPLPPLSNHRLHVDAPQYKILINIMQEEMA